MRSQVDPEVLFTAAYEVATMEPAPESVKVSMGYPGRITARWPGGTEAGIAAVMKPGVVVGSDEWSGKWRWDPADTDGMEAAECMEVARRAKELDRERAYLASEAGQRELKYQGLDAEVREFVENIDDLLRRVDDLPERAEDFAGSVQERLEDIRDWAIGHNYFTPAQEHAVDNMGGGISRWER